MAKLSGVRNAFYAQSGGVTAVINASAAGVIETARRHRNRIGKVYAGRDGIIGALTEDLIDTGKESRAALKALHYTPSGAFGPALSESCPQAPRVAVETRETRTIVRSRESFISSLARISRRPGVLSGPDRPIGIRRPEAG